MSSEREIKTLLDGIYRIRVPAPVEWMPETSCYLLVSREEVAVIDPGYPSPQARELLKELLPKDKKVLVLLTHGHIDHYAAASWLAKDYGAEVLVHPLDLKKVTMGAIREVISRAEDVKNYWLLLGFTEMEEVWTALRKMESLYPSPIHEVRPVTSRIRLHPLEVLVVHTPGHTSGSVCFFVPQQGLLFSGDTLLPLGQETWLSGPTFCEEGAHLSDYKKSLEKIAALCPKLILPGHGEPFDDLTGKLLEVRSRHLERRKKVLSVLAEGLTAYQISCALEPELEGYRRLLSVGMVYAALLELESEGIVRRKASTPLLWTLS